jgi:hypothetical protein
MSAPRLAKVLMLLLAGSGLVGCAPRRQPTVVAPPPAVRPVPPPAPVPPPPPSKRIKMTVLPAEKFLLPKAAAAINERLAHLQMAGVDEIATAAISMETAELQAECPDTGEACWAKVANMLGADRLLWVEMGRGLKKKKGPVQVSIVLFDAEKSAVLSRADEMLTAASDDAAVDRLLDPVLGPAHPAPGATP